jgi:virginiamycin A acetyltransferase
LTNLIDQGAIISPLADIEVSSRGSRVIIGKNTRVDSFVKMKFAGGPGDIQIGANSYINSGTVIYNGGGVWIGENVLIAANTTFATANHAFDDPERPIRLQGFKPSKGGIRIEDDCWIGANCVLLDGAIIRAGCVVAAGTIVRGEVPAMSVIGGNPWRILRSRCA